MKILDALTFTFTFTHLADAFIQSDLQYIQAIQGLASFHQRCPVHLFAIVACVDIIEMQMQLAHLCFNILQRLTSDHPVILGYQ